MPATHQIEGILPIGTPWGGPESRPLARVAQLVEHIERNDRDLVGLLRRLGEAL